MSGLLTMSVRGTEYEIIRGIACDPTVRLATLVVATSTTVEIRRVNLFGVASISPNVFDSQGGTTLTLTGEGLSACV